MTGYRATAATSLLVLVLVFALFGPVVWGAAAERVDTGAIWQAPSGAHPLGTDGLGRDLLARVLVATRLSVLLAVSATLLGAVAGVLLGVLPSVLGPIAGRVIGTVIDILLMFPALLLVMFLAIVFGAGTAGVLVAFAIASMPGFARLTQTLAASVADADYLAAARVLGVRRHRLLYRHVLPNIVEPLAITVTSSLAFALVAISGLSFLGLGVGSPSYDWGLLLGQGLDRIYLSPAAALGPGVAIVLAGLGFQLFGEALARAAGGHRRTRFAGAGAPAPAPEGDHVLRARSLTVEFPGSRPVRGVDLTIGNGEIVGVVGESGSGKTLTALAVAGLVPHPGRVSARELELDRGALAMVFQNPGTALHPTIRIGRQLAEVAEVHAGLSKKDAMNRAVARLRAVAIQDPPRRARQYAHELSGGMQQRAVIGMGLMGTPRLVIADEPTTALDVTVQRRILGLLASINAETGASVLLISHDLAVVAEISRRVLVMYAGLIVEELPVSVLRARTPAHPYTAALLATSVDLDTDRDLPLATIPGRPPTTMPDGCPFAPRCPRATRRCATETPRLREHARSHRVACWHPL
ncbi:dipeptide/oligopeptide/nickel ABC transporter permease/ATP-binding protein [Amycolatopsis alba]|uniref:Peptide ABC transporter ATP-binding protein n=2 Tax=Amycolatopsis TaxID=1813 RepID=A0A229RAB8_AMYAL|nr:dipeptide/oligopeptide/nickel ABC transporter permease/ATP-binding protein [Amycolatopsis alba]OXM43587.1 peptide ABC transporter ATP-binding protein [Amycolatopsis alba DSM 44262]QGJ79648.1 Peptide ABC superfamily ATP-binding protein [Amycolatopsis sp. CP2808]